MLCKSLQQYSEYSFFGGILKTSGVTPFFAIWICCHIQKAKSPLSLQINW